METPNHMLDDSHRRTEDRGACQQGQLMPELLRNISNLGAFDQYTLFKEAGQLGANPLWMLPTSSAARRLGRDSKVTRRVLGEGGRRIVDPFKHADRSS